MRLPFILVIEITLRQKFAPFASASKLVWEVSQLATGTAPEECYTPYRASKKKPCPKISGHG